MKPKIILTVASILYVLMAVGGFLGRRGEEFSFFASLGSMFPLCLAILFWSVRSAPQSKPLDAILFTGFLAFFLGGLLAFYGQWSGNYMDSPAGYIDSAAWLGMGVWFFFVWRANRSTSAS